MPDKRLTKEHISNFRRYLYLNEKSPFTIDKYIRDVKALYVFLSGKELSRESLISYREHLARSGRFSDGSINSMLSSIRAFLSFMGHSDCRVKNLRIQETPYNPEERCLTKAEFKRLLNAARGDERLRLILLTLFSTGVRVSELRYFTAEAFRKKGKSVCVTVRCKNKNRRVMVPEMVRREITEYIRKKKIMSGPVFSTKSGRPVDRSNLWKQMKGLCQKARVEQSKVFPHNLRRLFARTYYEKTHDIVELSCLLGHSSINTTKLYVKTTEKEVRAKMERVVNILCFGKDKDKPLSA